MNELIRRELRRPHIEVDPAVVPGLSFRGSVLRGRIGFDLKRRGPCVYVDRRKIDWAAFGDLALAHEGFQFRLEFFDPTDEVP